MVAEDGRFLGWAAYSAKSQIIARVMSFDESAVIDEAFFRSRIGAAVARRTARAHDRCNAPGACRSDGLPGLVADRYANVVVMHCSRQGSIRSEVARKAVHGIARRDHRA